MKDAPPTPPKSIPPPPYPADSKHPYPHPPPPLPLTQPSSAAPWRYYLTSLAASLFLLYLLLPPTVTSLTASVASTDLPYFSADRFLASRLGYKLVTDLPAPGKKVKHGDGHGRVIVIGDVHGMFAELVTLLKKADYDPETDYLVFSGDMISKGPDSLKVVDLARKYSAGCVRGNHEDRVLLHWHDLQRKKKARKGKGRTHSRAATIDEFDNMELENSPEIPETDADPETPDILDTDIDAEDEFMTERIRNERKLAKSLSRKQAAWLDACPLVLRMKDVAHLGQVDIVHAGLVHGVHLEDQDPKAIMNMRSLDKRRHTPLPEGERDGIHWADVWNSGEQEKRSGGDEGRTTVVYGHYAAKGLDIRKFSKGLDSNCVRGGRLSAYVIGKEKEELVSVKCRSFFKD